MRCKREFGLKTALLSFALTFVLFGIFLFSERVVPFGDRTFLMHDVKRQYISFYSYYQSVLRGENDIFYTMSACLGSGMIGTFAYYLTSPFLLILYFIPLSAFPTALSLIIWGKVSLISFTTSLFLQKQVTKDKLSTVLFSVAFSLCSFIITNDMNLMWLDVYIMLPVLLLLTDRLVSTGKTAALTVAVAITMYLNYYIGYMTMIFVCIWLVYRLVTKKDEIALKPIDILIRFGGGTLLAAGIDAFLLLPTFIGLQGGEKDIGYMGIVMKDEAVNPAQLLSKTMIGSFDGLQIYWGSPHLYCGILVLLFAVMYFFNRNIKLKEKLCMGAILLMFVASFQFEPLNLIWHAGTAPSGYRFRQAVFLVFLMIYCGMRAYDCMADALDFKRIVGWALTCALIFSIPMLLVKEAYMNFEMKLTNIIFIAVETVAVLILFIFKSRVAVGRLCLGLFGILLSAELVVNADGIYMTDAMNQIGKSEFESKTAAVEKQLETVGYIPEADMYRIENLSPVNENDSMMFGYNGLVHYSSEDRMFIRRFLKKLGYTDNGLYIEYDGENTKTSDAILGIRYVLNNGSIKKNENVLPIAVGVISSKEEDLGMKDTDPFSLQNEIMTYLSGEKADIFIAGEVMENIGEYINAAGETVHFKEYTVTPKADGELYFYMGGIENQTQDMALYLEDTLLGGYGNASCLQVLNLGERKTGENVNFRIECTEKIPLWGEAFFETEDMGRLSQVCEKIKSNMDEEAAWKISSSHYTILMEEKESQNKAASATEGILLSIPYDKNWMVSVNGRRVDTSKALDAFLYVDIGGLGILKDEDITVDIKFVPEGFETGVFISCISLIILALQPLFTEPSRIMVRKSDIRKEND